MIFRCHSMLGVVCVFLFFFVFCVVFVFFFQAEDGIRDVAVTGVQTCALPISITIPSGATITNSGTATGFGGGKVLQVLTATDSSARTTTSTSFVTASNTLSVNITPSATSSKIFVQTSFECSSASSGRSFFTIYRDSSNLGNTNGMFSVGGQELDGQSGSMTFLDSPSSTSQLTYAVYMKSNGQTASINANTTKGSIVVMEIGA